MTLGSCTGDAAPRVVNMHGGKGGVHVRGGRYRPAYKFVLY